MVNTFQVKLAENERKTILRDKETRNKIPLMFLDFKVLAER